MSQQVAERGSGWWGGGSAYRYLGEVAGIGSGEGDRRRTGGGWGVTTGGGKVGGGGGEGGGRATALRTQRPERAASADPGARTAPRRGRDFRQGHRLEQAAQGALVGHLGASPLGGVSLSLFCNYQLAPQTCLSCMSDTSICATLSVQRSDTRQQA